MSERFIAGVFLDTEQATRFCNVCMGVIEMAEAARTEDQIPMCTLAVFRRELLNLLEVGSGFSFIGRRDSDFKASAKKHLGERRGKLDAAIADLKSYQ